MAALGEHLPATRRGVIGLGSRRELFVDDYLIERRRSTSLVLQAPTHEIACVAESRDGIHWVRPKLVLREFRRLHREQPSTRDRWSQRNNMIAWGLLETAPERSCMPTELSL
jgi:hypothetical protein